jgi:hypothetical protein
MAKHSCCCCQCETGAPGKPGGPGQPGTPGGPTGGGPTGGGPTIPPQNVGTWVLIRFDAADLGARPIPAGDTWWESPDIWLTGGDALGNPIGGQPTQVYTRIWNLGTLPAVPVYVNFYFIAPSLGILPSAPQQIGSVSAVVFIPPLSCVTVPCPTLWIPPVTEFNLHACLLVTCTAPLTGDAITVPFNAVADRHNGQHNLTITEAGGTELPFTLHLGNPLPMVTQFELMATAAWQHNPRPPLRGFTAPPSLNAPVDAILRSKKSNEHRLWARRAAILLERPVHDYHPIPAGEVGGVLQLTHVRHGEIRRSSALAAPVKRFGTMSANFATLGDAIELRPQQQATATFSIARPAGEREKWFVVQLAQVSNGAIVGGYTVAVRR